MIHLASVCVSKRTHKSERNSKGKQLTFLFLYRVVVETEGRDRMIVLLLLLLLFLNAASLGEAEII